MTTEQLWIEIFSQFIVAAVLALIVAYHTINTLPRLGVARWKAGLIELATLSSLALAAVAVEGWVAAGTLGLWAALEMITTLAFACENRDLVGEPL